MAALYLPHEIVAGAAEHLHRAGRRTSGPTLSCLKFADAAVKGVIDSLLDGMRSGAPDLYADQAAHWLATHLLIAPGLSSLPGAEGLLGIDGSGRCVTVGDLGRHLLHIHCVERVFPALVGRFRFNGGAFGGLSSPFRTIFGIHAGPFAARVEGTCMKEKPFQPPILVKLDEAAALLSVSLRTVQRMVKDGRLAAVHPTPDAPRLRYDDLVRTFAGTNADATGATLPQVAGRSPNVP